MATVKTLNYSMPRGDSRTLPVSVPVGTYTTGAHIFFALKSDVDNDLLDNSAVLKKTLGDTNITSTDATNVNYLLTLTPTDTNLITPAIYRAEFEYVSADVLTVITFPDPSIERLNWEITGDVNRRVA